MALVNVLPATGGSDTIDSGPYASSKKSVD